MNLHVFHLEARAAFHFGIRGVGIEASADHAPSDTLFSALCNTIRVVESVDTLEEMLTAFVEGEPPFLLSGGFPYIKVGNTYHRFYPAPVTLRHNAEKELRKAAWLAEDYFIGWVNGGITIGNLMDEAVQLKPRVLMPWQQCVEMLWSMHPKKVAGHQKPRDRASCQALLDQLETQQQPFVLWDVDEAPRVAVDRVTNASAVYQAGRLRFADGGGLWCGFVGLADNSVWSPSRMKELLQVLGHNGLGGERSSGYGQYVIDTSDPVSLSLPDASSTESFVTLSHYHPRWEERDTLRPGAAYDLITRRGWMNSPDNSGLRRKPVRMIAAGGVLQSTYEGHVYGDIVDVTPDMFHTHRVYRYGYAFPVGTVAR